MVDGITREAGKYHMGKSDGMIPLSAEFAIREAIALLRASRRNFKSAQVEQARRLLEKLLELEGLPPTRGAIDAEKTIRENHDPEKKI